ncbi:MAG TPA: DUF3024 domain-containing protein [Aldersonia sp.]
MNFIRVSDEVSTALRDIALLDSDCECAVFSAYVQGDDIILPVSDDELDELIGTVAADANRERNRRRRRRLDAAFAVLNQAAGNPRRQRSSSMAPDGSVARDESSPRPPSAATGVPELDVARVQRWCGARVPEHARHQVRLECEVARRQLTIVERRVPWRDDLGPEWTSLPIARLRYTETAKKWSLYWRDSNLRFHAYDRLPRSQHIENLLAEIDRDPTGIFWG